MLKWLKLSHHAHSGKLRPHEHTSYLPLTVLLVVVGFALSFYTSASSAPPPPAGSSIGLSGQVAGPAPTVAATIKKPSDQQHFGTSPITISGSCPKNTLVEIFKNDIFAGSTICEDDGNYSLDVDLLIGRNIIVARVYDALNQAGPDSNTVIVYYDALPPQAGPEASLVFGSSQLLLNTDAVFRGVFPDQELNIPVDILGGSPPYAVNIQWGDSNNKVVPRSDNLGFKVGHTYKKAGTYQVTLQATDANDRVAFLTVAAIVNGQPSVAAASSESSSGGGALNQLLVLWPVYTGLIGVVVSFWLGERREKRVLANRGLVARPQN